MNIDDYLKRGDNCYQTAIELDKQNKFTEALASYRGAQTEYESVRNFQPYGINPSQLQAVETNLERISNRINELNYQLQNYYVQNQSQLMYPKVPPASYAGISNYSQPSTYPVQSPQLHYPTSKLDEIDNMSSGSPPPSQPQAYYPQPALFQNSQDSNQIYFQQGQTLNQIPQQSQNQVQTQSYQQQQNFQDFSKSYRVKNPKPILPSGQQCSTSNEDDHNQKKEKKGLFHFGKSKNHESKKPDDKKKKKTEKDQAKSQPSQLHSQQAQLKSQKQLQQQSQPRTPPKTQPQSQLPNVQIPQPRQPYPQQFNQSQQIIPQQQQQQFVPQAPQSYYPQQSCQQYQQMNFQVQQQQLNIQSQQNQGINQLPKYPMQQPPSRELAPECLNQSFQNFNQLQDNNQFQNNNQYQNNSQFQNNNQYQNNSQFQNNNQLLSNNQPHNNSQPQSNNQQPNISQVPNSIINNAESDDSSEDQTSSKSSLNKRSHVLMSDRIIQPNNYKEERVLGRGANGVVYLVKDVHDGNEYAMKELLHQLVTPEEQKSFFREIEMMIYADHPAVVKLIGFSMTDLKNKNSPILVLEYMPNGSLQDVIEKNKKFTLTQKYIALYGIAEAMKYLHSLDIVHRDLKPANVLLNQFDEPAVGDFGLSKTMDAQRMRQTVAAGSPVYMAPELMMRQEYTDSIDVYAYGYICYEVLLEEMSFSNVTSVIDLVNRVCSGERPTFYGKNIDEEWKELIQSCWEANPYQRPTFREICQKFVKRALPFQNIDMLKFNQYELKIKNKK